MNPLDVHHYVIREYNQTLCGINTSKGGWLFIRPESMMPVSCKFCNEKALGMEKYWKCFQSGYTDEELAKKTFSGPVIRKGADA